jgi:hypothetical protein
MRSERKMSPRKLSPNKKYKVEFEADTDDEPLKAQGLRMIDQINLDKHNIHRDIDPKEFMPGLSKIATKADTTKLKPFKSPFLKETIYELPEEE